MNNSVIVGLLARDGILVYKTRGVRMESMLWQNRHLVVIRVPSSSLRKFDVALYKRKKFVLHRVLTVRDEYFLIRGDNTYALETVPDSAVIGVLDSFKRNGRKISVEKTAYIGFTFDSGTLSIPLRVVYICFRRLAVKSSRRLGVLPLIKKMLEKCDIIQNGKVKRYKHDKRQNRTGRHLSCRLCCA